MFFLVKISGFQAESNSIIAKIQAYFSEKHSKDKCSIISNSDKAVNGPESIIYIKGNSLRFYKRGIKDFASFLSENEISSLLISEYQKNISLLES